MLTKAHLLYKSQCLSVYLQKLQNICANLFFSLISFLNIPKSLLLCIFVISRITETPLQCWCYLDRHLMTACRFTKLTLICCNLFFAAAHTQFTHQNKVKLLRTRRKWKHTENASLTTLKTKERLQWAIYCTSPQSFIITFSYSLA